MAKDEELDEEEYEVKELQKPDKQEDYIGAGGGLEAERCRY